MEMHKTMKKAHYKTRILENAQLKENKESPTLNRTRSNRKHRGGPHPEDNRPHEGGGRKVPPRVRAHLGAAAPQVGPPGPSFL